MYVIRSSQILKFQDCYNFNFVLEKTFFFSSISSCSFLFTRIVVESQEEAAYFVSVVLAAERGELYL